MSEHPNDEPQDVAPESEPPATVPDSVPADASPFDMPEGSGVQGGEMWPERRVDPDVSPFSEPMGGDAEEE
jgi:hypothetical protein